ncbi:sensor domain-containing diguanylate cyclase [Phaeobacter sp.]|uniref:sensor domain-containing diguanylate cyclase n=1 Tax=Phaeobacter sp. TaxID=1902409 RepID=UPI0025F30CAC|nr:sensor domain-containing diguanylate cyclase [Phaeobacter sp.]
MVIETPNAFEQHATANGTAEQDLQAQMVDVLNQMEQGILVWSPDGICTLHNERIFQVLELGPQDLRVGMGREAFLTHSVNQGVISAERKDEVQRLFQSGQPFHFDRNMASGKVISSFARPLKDGGYVVTFTDITQFRQDAADLAAAKQVAEAAEQRAKDMLAKEQSWRAEVRALADLDEWLQCCKSLDELFVVVEKFMSKALPLTQGELYIYSNSRDVLDGACCWGGAHLHEHIAPDSCWALRRGRGYRYDASGFTFECGHVADHPLVRTVDDALCIPIVAHGDTVGLLHVTYPPQTDKDTAKAGYELALQCGEHISLAIANVKLRDELHDQSTRDPLTRLYNRRYFLEAMRAEQSMASRKNTPFSLLSFDADKFKAFNDNHGHDAGDMVLRAISDKMQEVFHTGAICCRFGGEEFSVLLPGASSAVATDAAEALRAAIEDTTVQYSGGKLPGVTISIGVASFPDHGALPQDLLNAADRALYAAKAAGRNCVRLAGQETGSDPTP